MTKKTLFAIVVMFCVGVAGWRSRAEGGGKETPKLFNGAALHLVPKNGQVGYFLKEPSVIMIGDQAFIVGVPIRQNNNEKDGPKRVWVLVSGVAHIEEFESVQALRKFYTTD